MDLQQTLDSYPLGIVLVLSLVIMIGAIELGYKLGKGILGVAVKAQLAQVRAIMGASLGLLAFMLAFSFSIAQSHFELRTQAYMQEVSSIRSAYISAGLLDEVERVEARRLIQEFVQHRLALGSAVEANNMAEAVSLVEQGEEIHNLLWYLTEDPDEESEVFESDLFAQAVIAMIDANGHRKQASLYNRISLVIWVTLMFMSALSMLVMGYQAGLTGAPSRLATWSLTFTFATVMTLVTDLDRPRMSLFSMNQQQMIELREFMADDQELRASTENRFK